MRFVLANRLLSHAGGTETHLVTIGDQLLRLGHEVVVYSPELGPFADYARGRGLPVTDQLLELPGECDVVFAQDALVVYDLAERYPHAQMIFRVCGDIFDFQSPPQLDGIIDLVVVLSDRYARLARACAVDAPMLRLRIPVDVDRLTPIGGIRPRPRRAVILGNYPDRVHAVKTAWEQLGMEVGQIGGSKQQYDLAAALSDADIVVAKSRAALDGMSCGRAVYIFDMFGGDGWVTPEAYPAMEADHFAGQATDRVIGTAELERDLADYDPAMGEANRDLVVQHHRARDHVIEFLTALPARPAQKRPPAPLHELSRLSALQWSWERSAREGTMARAELKGRLDASERQREEAERARDEALREVAQAAALRAELDGLKTSRAWRLAALYWRWRDRLLRPSGRPGI
jgi:hypothetical protein